MISISSHPNAEHLLGSIGAVRVDFRISEGPDGHLTTLADSPDQQGFDIPVAEVICTDKTLRLHLKPLPNLNHLHQTVVPGGPTAYGEVEQTMPPAALSGINDWLGTQGFAKSES